MNQSGSGFSLPMAPSQPNGADNGHDHHQLLDVLSAQADQKPNAVVAHTTKGKGISFMENKVEWHYKNPSDEQLAKALAELEVIHA